MSERVNEKMSEGESERA